MKGKRREGNGSSGEKSFVVKEGSNGGGGNSNSNAVTVGIPAAAILSDTSNTTKLIGDDDEHDTRGGVEIPNSNNVNKYASDVLTIIIMVIGLITACSPHCRRC